MDLRRVFAKVSNVFHRYRADQDLTREVASHLAMLEEEFLRQGLTPDEARFAARRAYGGVEQAKELHRDERSFLSLEQAFQDLRHALRSLRKSPGFVAVALLSLAFGIGVNTSIFTLVNGILLKNLPVPDPNRIVQVVKRFDKSYVVEQFSFPIYREIRRQSAIFEDVIGFGEEPAVLDIGNDQHRIEVELVTGTYFDFFRARPALGRLLDREDDRAEGAHRVCVLSYEFWNARFGADPDAVGKTIRIEGTPVEVVGVTERGFAGAELQRRYDLFVATALGNTIFRLHRESFGAWFLRIVARLQPEVPFEQARTRLEAASASIEARFPEKERDKGAVYQLRDASKGADRWRTTLRDPLLILMGAVTLVLLIACANLANLLLARSNERRQEFAIKLSLGISRWRLLRQLLVETALVSLVGGVLALFLSTALTRVILTLFNTGKQDSNLMVGPDRIVLLSLFGVCLVAAFIAGLYPAWNASRTDATPGKALHSARPGPIRRGLILVQVTLTVVLLLGASLFAHSLRRLKTIDLGYDVDHVFTFFVEQRGAQFAYADLPAWPAAPHFGDLLNRIRQVPGVESAAVSIPSVMSSGRSADEVRGKDIRPGRADVLFVSPGYFSTMRIPLLLGRDFTIADRMGTQRVSIVDQRFVSRFWPAQNPIGKHFLVGDPSVGETVDFEAVGVVGDSVYQDLREKRSPTFYWPFDQSPQLAGAVEVRFRGSSGPLERAIRPIVAATVPDYEIANASSLEQMRDGLIAQDRLLAFLSSLFGVLGTALALVGIYGLISYSVTRQTREIGIRMSVGAQRGDVLWLFVKEGVVLDIGGTLIGVPIALDLAGFLRKMLYDVPTYDPPAIGATLALIAMGGLMASLIPARRATRVNPIEALRHD